MVKTRATRASELQLSSLPPELLQHIISQLDQSNVPMRTVEERVLRWLYYDGGRKPEASPFSHARTVLGHAR